MSGSQRTVKLGTLLMGVVCFPLIAHAIPEGPAYPSAAWFAREAANFAKVSEAPTEQATNIRAGCTAP
jgi:hypothetical protein